MIDTLRQLIMAREMTGPSVDLLLALLVVDLGITLLHGLQELRPPLWRYFGAIAGVRLPDSLGFLIYFGVVTVVLWGAALAGIAGYSPFVYISPQLADAALGFMIGGRIWDAWSSHIRLHQLGFRPNPGYKTAPLHLAEAFFLLGFFLPELLKRPGASATGSLAGALFFAIALPFARLAGRLFPSWRAERPWRPGDPIPPWGR